MIILRREIGDVLRGARQLQGRTLREVSGLARVSLGYLSEVERGQKEASSELLSSICDALEVPMSVVLREVSDRVAAVEKPAAGSVSKLSALGTLRSDGRGDLVKEIATETVRVDGRDDIALPAPAVLRATSFVPAA